MLRQSYETLIFWFLLTFDIASGALLRQVQLAGGGDGLAPHPDGQHLVGLSPKRSVTKWDAKSGAVVYASDEPPEHVLSGQAARDGIAVSPDGRLVAVSTWTRATDDFRAFFSLGVFDLEAAEWLWIERESPRLGGFSPNGAHLLVRPFDFQLQFRSSVLQLRDPKDGAVIRTQILPEAETKLVRSSPDGDRVFWLSAPDKVSNRSTAAGASLKNRSLLAVYDDVGKLLWSHYVQLGAQWVQDNNAEILTAEDDQLVRRNADTGASLREGTDADLLAEIAGQSDVERSHPDGALTAKAEGGAARVYTANGTQAMQLLAESSSWCMTNCGPEQPSCANACATKVDCVAWSPSGDRLVIGESASESRTAAGPSISRGPGIQQLRVVAWPGGEELQRVLVTDLDPGCSLSWHPSGDALFFGAHGELMKLDLSASTSAGACSPDGNYLGTWSKTDETGPCDPFPFAGDNIFWRIGPGATKMSALGLSFDGVLDAEACTARFKRTIGADTMIVDFVFTGGGKAEATMNLERSQAGQPCLATYSGSLTERGALRPFANTGPVALGERLNIWTNAQDPHMVVAADGGAIVTWTEGNLLNEPEKTAAGQPKADLVARVFDPATDMFSAAVELDDNDEGPFPYDLAGAPGGSAVVAFVQPDARQVHLNHGSVFANVYTPGSGFGGSVPIENLPGLELDGSRAGNLFAVANDTPTGFEAMVLFTDDATAQSARYVGGSWAATRPADWTLSRSQPACPATGTPVLTFDDPAEVWAVAMNADGDVLVVSQIAVPDPRPCCDGFAWSDLYFARHSAADDSWQTNYLDSSEAVWESPACEENDHPKTGFPTVTATALSDGRFLVVYVKEDAAEPGQLFARIVDADGRGPAMNFGSIDGHIYEQADDIRLAAGGDGGAVVTWDATMAWYSATFDGTAFGAPVAVLGDVGRKHFDLAVTPAGDALFATSFANANRGQHPSTRSAVYTRLPAGSTMWSAPEELLTGLVGTSVEVGIDDSGGALIMLGYERAEAAHIDDLTVTRP